MAECACGCREQTAGGTFRPGHDSYLALTRSIAPEALFA
jgi:hypothetical protein